MKSLYTKSLDVLTIIGFLSIIGMILILSSCETSNIAPSDDVNEEELTGHEQAFVNNIGELHNFVLKKIYEKHEDEIPIMLGSREGLERMVDILIEEAKSSNLWTLPHDEHFVNRDEVITAIVNIYSGNHEEIENYSGYSDFLLFNLDSLTEWNNKFPNIDSYKKDIPRLSNEIQAVSTHTVEQIMLNTIEASNTLWKDQDLVSAFISGNQMNQAKKGNFVHFPKPVLSREEASEATCAMLTAVADAEGGAIGFIGGGVFGGFIGGAIGSAVFIHTSRNAGVCYTE